MSAFRIDDLPIESSMLTSALDEAQRKVESYFFDIRKQLFEYDQVINTQRDRVYADRRRALESEDLGSLMLEYAEKTVDDVLEANIPPATPPEEWSLEALAFKMKQYCPLMEDLTTELLMEKSNGDYENLRSYLHQRGEEAYQAKVEEAEKAEAGLSMKVARFFVLAQTDNLWRDHLQAVKFLQQAVSLRGYAQRDPLVEFKLEAFELYLEMMAQIRRNVIYNIYVFRPEMARVGDDGRSQAEVEKGVPASNGKSAQKTGSRKKLKAKA